MLRYKLRVATVGIHEGNPRPSAISIPAGTVLQVPDGFVNASGFVEVEWDGKTVQMFAVDLSERGELIQVASETGGGR
jgi:hypothetical protein